jgi:hypothetical protein
MKSAPSFDECAGKTQNSAFHDALLPKARQNMYHTHAVRPTASIAIYIYILASRDCTHALSI